MAKDAKFGTFGGVFTPSILTILGVIMYLRLPMVVGNAGLYAALGIVAVAHVISITTGLSISSIATDKSVGAGGPYYIVSRSLGLPIGGTLGLALFVGLSFSISLYVIGFSESFLGFIGVAPSLSAIRLTGTITVIAVTAVTLISTAFAIKTQYLILTLIGLSLISIMLGGGGDLVATEAPHLEPLPDGPSMETLFGIFFPAVTGFTAGVNMSGDLRNPKKAIPIGTMAAILAGMAVYVGLCIFFAFRVERGMLVGDGPSGNPDVLVQIAMWGPAVTAGIWGATLSSAIGSIMGAPRILQALSTDRITPRFFAKGAGKTGEPRRALLLAFAIGEAGILIGELNVIARVVSMVFLATYGFLNISCAIESWASPDFRPEFRIPRLVSITGAIFCMLVMIQLDLAAMAASTVLLTSLFLYLQRKQLTLDAGDTWEGIWSSIVRAGLHRLSRSQGQRRNWRPNLLLFAHKDSKSRGPLVEFASTLIGGSGMLTDFVLTSPEQAKKQPKLVDPDESPVGIFRRLVPCPDYYEFVASACRYHGFTGVMPNAVLMDWDVDRSHPERLGELFRTATETDFNLLLLSYDREHGFRSYGRIDIWWRVGQGNVALGLAIVRFLNRMEPWLGAKVRFVLLSEDTASNDALRSAMTGILADARVEATVRVMTAQSKQEGLESAVRQESSDASLTVVGLPERVTPDVIERYDALRSEIGSMLFIRGNSMFAELLPVGEAAASRSRSMSAQQVVVDVPELEMPDAPVLARTAREFLDGLENAIDRLQDEGIARSLDRDAALVEEIGQLVERHFELLRKAQAEGGARARKPGGRAQSGFLFQARKLLEEFETEAIGAQRATLEGRLDGCLQALSAMARNAPLSLRVIGRDKAFAPDPAGAPKLESFKRRRRILATLTRRPVSYDVPLRALATYHLKTGALDILDQAVEAHARCSHQIGVEAGKVVNAASTDLVEITSGIARGDIEAGDLEARKRKILGNLDACAQRARERLANDRHTIAHATRGLAQSFANDLARVNIRQIALSERRVPKNAADRGPELRTRPDAWARNQAMIIQRAELALTIAAFQNRFTTIARRARADVALQIRNGALGALIKLEEQLRTFLTGIEHNEGPALSIDVDLRSRFEAREAIERLSRDVVACTEDLPESSTTLSDESFNLLGSGHVGDVEEVNISVRPLVQYLLEHEFVAVMSRELSGIPLREHRAVGVAHDVTRLVEFTYGDLESMGGWESEAFRSQMLSVVRSGVHRIEEERAALQAAAETCDQEFEQRIQLALEGTDPYTLTTHSDSLSQYIRSRGSKRAVSRVRELGDRIAGKARDAMVSVVYRGSSGLLLAKRLQRPSEPDAVFDRAVRLTRRSTPAAKVLDSLPFYYRQLFSGQATISETFWIGRDRELEQARDAIRAHQQGVRGVLFVTGEVGSGKTAMCQAIVHRHLAKRKVFRITPPPGGTLDGRAMRRALENEMKQRGDLDRLFRDMPDGSVVIFDDLELWWERSAGGTALIERFSELVERHGGRCLFIANLNRHAFRFVDQSTRLTERALRVLECEPFAAEDLKSIILVRHGSTGLHFRLGKLEQDDIPPWTQARLFTRYFSYSRGLVGASLRAWLTHIDKVDGNSLVMRRPGPIDAAVVDDLRVELHALLLQLVLHKQITMQRLERVTGQGTKIRRDLDRLVSMGLVRRNAQQVMHIDRFVAHLVTERLRERGLLR